MRKAGMLAPNTDPAALAKRVFAHLEGVTDEWIENTEVQKVAGGQSLPKQNSPVVAQVVPKDGSELCCAKQLTN